MSLRANEGRKQQLRAGRAGNKAGQRNPRKYPGLTLLGDSHAAFPETPQFATLETFPNPFPGRDYTIRIDSPEFTSICPVTGQPDFAQIQIQYVPNKRCVETKSLKLYLSSYRNVPSFNEEVINRILNDLAKACAPRQMCIEGRFVARGGISLTVTVEHPSPRRPALAKA